MTEYIDIPAEQVSRIADAYGREFDKYPPHNSSALSLAPSRQNGPPITPIHMMPRQRSAGNSFDGPPRTPMMRSPPTPNTPMMRSQPPPGTPGMRSQPPPGTPGMRSQPPQDTPRQRSGPSPGTPRQRYSPGPHTPMLRSPPAPPMLQGPATEQPYMSRSPPQTRMPGMRSPPAQAGPMPGAARFREADSIEPARFTDAPTHVSYPQSQAPSWISVGSPPPHSARAESSFFVPRGASTPAPQSRYGEPVPSFPGGFRDDAPPQFDEPPPHFEEPQHDSGEHPHQPESFEERTDHFEPVSHLEGDESYIRDPASFVDSGYLGPSMGYEGHGDETRSANDRTVDEEEFIPDSFANAEPYEDIEEVPNNQSHFSDNTSFKVNDVDPSRPWAEPKPKKGFVGGFFSGIRHIPRMWSSSRSGKSVGVEHATNTDQSRPTLPPQPSYPDLPNFGRPPNPVPDTTGDISRQTESTASSHSGPRTPDQSGASAGLAIVEDDPGPLPNPYESSGMPQAQPNIASPQAVVLQQAEDYDAMTEEPSYDAYPDTLGTHINRVGKFVKDLVHLPWINAHATVEYRPAESRRAYPKKPGQSWYAKEHHEKLDLLAGPTQPPPRTRDVPRSAPRAVPRGQESPRRHRTTHGQTTSPNRARSQTTTSSTRSLDAATAIRPTTTPASLTTHGGLIRIPSPGASSHGNGQHSYSYAYYSPSPLYVYPAQVGAGGGAAGAPDAAGVGAGVVPAGFPGALPLAMPPTEGGSPQAVPVFMLAAPPAYGMPRSTSPRKHRRHHSSRKRGEQKGSSSPPPPVPAIPTMPTPTPLAAGRRMSLDS